MRIIDKNQDYYDYLQDPTDTLVFDRRNSFVLTKQQICKEIEFAVGRINEKHHQLILQCGATFWVILLTITEEEDNKDYIWHPSNYELELLATVKDYTKPRELLKLSITSAGRYITSNWKTKTSVFDKSKVNVDEIKDMIVRDNFSYKKSINTLTVHKETKKGFDDKTYTIPLLKATGIADIIDPISIFTAIEEYFSLQKIEAERTEPIGATNNDKIIMHGFDTKTSFRGK